jgi:hypothetical protein
MTPRKGQPQGAPGVGESNDDQRHVQQTTARTFGVA